MTDTRLTGARPFATRSPERDWVSVHVHYQTGLDRLLTEAVDPLIRRLGEEGLHNGWFFLRYWDGGTHLRLRIRPSSPALAGRVGEQLSEELAGFLRVCPSPTVMSQEDYAQLARRLATGEEVEEFSSVLRPNNSLIFEKYRPEYERYPAGEPIDAVEQHFIVSSALALNELRSGASQNRRAGLALSIVVATWFGVLADPAERGEWGRRLLADTTEDKDVYQRQGEALRTRARRIADAVDRRRPEGPSTGEATTVLGQWHTSIQSVVAAATRYQQTQGPLPAARAFGLPAGAAVPDPRLPIADICAHLMLNRLGLSIPAEHQVRRLAARTVADLYPGQE